LDTSVFRWLISLQRDSILQSWAKNVKRDFLSLRKFQKRVIHLSVEIVLLHGRMNNTNPRKNSTMITPLEMARLAIRYFITRIRFADVSNIVREEDPANKERSEAISFNKKGRE